MSAGVERVPAEPHGDPFWGQQPATAEEPEAFEFSNDLYAEPVAEPGRGRTVLAGALIVLTIAWLAAFAYAVSQQFADATLMEVMGWLAMAAAPPILFALLWVIFGRTSRAETERFTQAVAAMRSEAQSLDQVLGAVTERLAANRSNLSEDAARLMQLGEEASDRLGRVTHYLSREGKELERKAQALEAAAGQARVDMGVLLADLPQAEQSARSFGETLREAGMTAHERARSLEAQLSAITARAQEVDASAGGAAERLGAHIAQIESSAGVAARELEEAAARLDAAVDGALGRTSTAVDATRAALELQAEGLLASIEQGRARFVDAGAEAGRRVVERLEMTQRMVAGLDAGIAAQASASEALFAGVAANAEELEQRLAALGERSESQSSQLATALAELRDATERLRGEIDSTTQDAAAMVSRAQGMGGALESVAAQLTGALTPGLEEAEARATALREAALAANDPVQAIQAAAADGAARLAEAEASLARQQAALEAMVTTIGDRAKSVEEQLAGLTAAAGEADQASSALVRDTGPQLVDALVRVREAARQASTNAREAISTAIPESATAFADAVREAVEAAVGESIRTQIAALGETSERATVAARSASERLTRQLLTLAEGAAALEAKIEEEREAREESERDGLSRRVALLIESLNSTAIDINKILSNDVTDGAWAAYLKGDRGVFTRRAVRLLDSGEAREVLRHYDQEPEFREQVNRYISDFEVMLRRVLADSDGHPIAVTLLSSDMGKLYVALAQAIQHLRV